MPHDTASILVVDDESVVRRVLGDALAQAGYRVRSAASGEAALSSMAEDPADLMLLDLQLGDTDGVEIMQIARERWPQTQVIILTAHGSLASAIAAVRHDAADYLLKPVGVEELRQRVGQVISRARAGRERQERIRSMYQQLQALVADEGLLEQQAEAAPGGERALSAGPLSIDVSRHVVRMAGHPIEVTPTEFAILHALARSQGMVVPCVQIVQSFQGAVEGEDEARQMLRPHIVRLRRKIEPDPANPAYIQSVRGVGYRWSSSGEASEEE
jgi:DNA-binding response OmpR family regulator